MLLQDLINGIYAKSLPDAFRQYPVKMVSCDSREKQEYSLFVAVPGVHVDGDDYISQAIAHGARVIVRRTASHVSSNKLIPTDVCVLDVEDPKDFLRLTALRFYQHPSTKVKTIAVTGTNGKTTITYLLESIIQAAHQRCGVIGTINHRIGTQVLPAKNTTPGFLDNQRYLAQLVQEGIDFCVMEASAHALAQGRVDGIDFVAGIFTNLTQDHLDYFIDMERYFQAKSLLFTQLTANAVAVINIDDAQGQRLVRMSQGRVIRYAIDHPADVKALHIKYGLSGTQFDVALPSGNVTVHSHFIGQHNVYNILAAFACAQAIGFKLADILEGLQRLRYVPGRLERVGGSANFFVFIDYAHTDDGLINVLKSLRAVSQSKIILVFGCGGDRDRGKRPKMGRAASTLADYSIVTSDNPRSEDPQKIIDDIMTGFTSSQVEVCLDRREAIYRALSMAGKDDIVLIAGKGHEDYQILKDRTIPFNERKIIEDFFQLK